MASISALLRDGQKLSISTIFLFTKDSVIDSQRQTPFSISFPPHVANLHQSEPLILLFSPIYSLKGQRFA
ncbi:hypothetical protein Mapa_006303 [Marchantia paleacea]|nr:hypothetical protein Mapa_006303 [Marchantia paleacea]